MIRAGAICLWLLLVGGTALAVQDSRDMKNRPVTKVVTLLKDMVGQLQKEAEEDDEVYETMGCWCETNDKEKTKAIADAETRIGKLNSDIEKLASTSAMLTNDISALEAEVASNTEALETATALRNKQLAEFTEEEKDMLASIGSLGSAVNALAKHHGGSFLQVSDGESIDLVTTIEDQMRKHKDMLAEVITPRQRRAVTSFIQGLKGDGTSLLQGPASYTPQSGEIFGVLKSMKESFETNLATSQKEESTNQQAYSDLKTAKDSEIKAGSDMIVQKTALRAETDEKHAQSKEDLAQTEETMAADIKYLASVKEHCANIDAEYAERVKTRQLEIGAVSKALAFLTSDEAQDLVSRTLGLAQEKTALLQERATRHSALAQKLQSVAKATHDPRLSALAVRVRLDAFAKVKASLQDMIDKLLKEKEEEIAKKDFCVDSLNENLRTTETREREKADAIAKIEDHTVAMATLTKNIADDKAEILELRTQLKKASEAKEKENKDFQETVADQRATQKLLSAALGVLKSFYEKAALVQVAAGQRAPAGPPPPPGFKKYTNNAASGGVMGMIQGIIDDAKAMEADALTAEAASQQAYEDFTNDTNEAVIALQKDIATKTEIHAKEEQDKVSEEATRDEKISNIEQLMKENLDIHADCDYMIKNFDIRMEARDSEVEALKQGLATFSGATFSAFLQDGA